MPCYYPILERKIQTHFTDVVPLDMPEYGVKMALFITLSGFMFGDMQKEVDKIDLLIALGYLWREKNLSETPKRLFEDEYFVSIDTVKKHIEEIFECVPSNCQKIFFDNLTTELCESHSHISSCLTYLKDCENVGPDHTEYSETSWPLLDSYPAIHHCKNHNFGDWLCQNNQLQHFVGYLYRQGSIVWACYNNYNTPGARSEAIRQADEVEYEEQDEALEYVSELHNVEVEHESEVEVEVEDIVEDEVEDEYDLSAQQDEEFAPNFHDEDEEFEELLAQLDETETETEDDEDEFISELDLAEISSIGTIGDYTDDELEYTISPDMFDD